MRVEARRLAREDGAEVEAEAVDVHLVDPVAQAVGHELDDARVREIQRVAGTRVVDVVALLVRDQPVVRGVVDAAERKRGPFLVSLGGVVVYDVDDHFQPCVVEARHHLLELLQRLRRIGRVARIGREEADGVVAPVVGELPLEQE